MTAVVLLFLRVLAEYTLTCRCYFGISMISADESWEQIFEGKPPGLESLIRLILRLDPAMRPSAQELTEHIWFNGL